MARERRSGWWPRPQVLLWTCAGIAVILSLAGVIAGQLDSTTEGPTPQQRTIILKLESVLLHDSVDPQYARVSLQPDDRGYLAGIADFATADGSASKVIDAYTARVGANVLARDYSAILARLAETRSAETIELDGYADAWRTTTRDPVFRQVQDNMLQAMYLEPAISAAHEQGVRSALGVAVFFDSLLQHGDSSSPDALPALIVRTNAAAGGSPSDTADEHAWVARFLDIRESTLLNPAEPAHQRVWPLTVARVHTLADLVRSNAWDLVPPVVVNPYGVPHALDASPPEVIKPSLSPPPSTPLTAGPEPTASRAPSQPGATSSSGAFPQLAGVIVGIAGLCLDLDGANPAPGRWVKTWECNGTKAQSWVAEPNGSLSITVTWTYETHTACVQPHGGLSLPNTGLEVDTCDPAAPSQQWRFEDGHIRNVAAGRCLSTPNDTTQAGVQVILANCANLPGQLWSVPH